MNLQVLIGIAFVLIIVVNTLIILRNINNHIFYCKKCPYKNSGACRSCRKDINIKRNKYNTYIQ